MHLLKDQSIARLIIFTAARLEQFANIYVLKPLGLTTTAIKIMGLLYYHSPLSPTDILKSIGGTKSNVTQRLDFLEKSGLITRFTPKKNGSDKRKKMIKLTADGKKRLVTAQELINEKSLLLEKCFSRKKYNEYFEFLLKINILVNQSEEEYLKLSPKKFNSGSIIKEMCELNHKNCETLLNKKYL